MIPKHWSKVIIGAVGCAWMTTPTAAQEKWRFQVTPYIWGTTLNGTLDPGGLPRVDLHRSREDTLDALNAAFFLNATARKGRFVAFGDLTYASLSERDDLSLSAPTGQKFKVPLKTDTKLTSATIAAGYTTVDTPELTMDLMVGARFWHMDVSVDAKNPVPSLPDSLSGNDSWTDPILAARARYQFAEDWSLIAYGDYGGFGVNSDETWQIAATVNYQINERFFVSGGYRVLALDYTYDGIALDMRLGGPLIGLTVRF